VTGERHDLEITTRVARAYWSEHAFRGYGLFRDLMSKASTSGMLALSLSGRRLSDAECAFVDEILVSLTVADPRIWPLKIGRIVGSYGRFIPAFAAGYLSIDGASVGPGPCGAASRVLREVFDAAAGRGDEPGAVERALRERVAPMSRLPGFGVPFRPVDERVVALGACVRARGRDRGTYWVLFEAMADFVRRERKLEPNIDAAVAAALLDLGFEGDVLEAMAAMLFVMTFLANAMEASSEPAAILRELPRDRVDYVGRPARESPRALSKRNLT
jgi:hypothetical protein